MREKSQFITPQEAAHILGASREEVYGFLRHGSLPAVKMDNTHWRIQRKVVEDILRATALHPAPTVEELRAREETRAFLAKAFGREPHDRELLVILFRFGPTHDRLEETGKRFGVTRERIRQMEATTLRRLRIALQHGKIEACDLPGCLNHLSRYLLSVAIGELQQARMKAARK